MSTFSIKGKLSEQRVDRELSLELGESPVHPEFISFQPPLKSDIDPHFHLELNWEFLLALAKIRWLHPHCFRSTARKNLRILGYGLHPDAFKRIGLRLRNHVNFL